MQELDRAFTEWPFLGVRQMRRSMVSLGYNVGKKRIRRLMRLMGLMAVNQKPKPLKPETTNKSVYRLFFPSGCLTKKRPVHPPPENTHFP
ncbi:MAG: IS3 family transposase [Desulfobulbus sp.]|jgi:hypothetical protein